MGDTPKPDATPEELRKKSNRELLDELSLLPAVGSKPWRLRELVLQVRNAETNERSSRDVIRLTRYLLVVTVVLAVLTAGLWWSS